MPLIHEDDPKPFVDALSLVIVVTAVLVAFLKAC